MADGNVSTIGKYEIIELIGEGAMGVVYKARDSVLDRTVAIKVMNESIARQEDLRQRFLREAKSAGSLQHPNVVTIHDLGETEGHLFIAMEFIEGVDLERLIEMREPLSLQVRLDIIIDVLTGLAFAHKRGIIHRDIKPANIRVGDDGRAKIMDFGVAHLMSSNMTTTGSVMGTPSYMAPEQITEGKCSPATDIFAVGAVLYQLLTSMKPFDAPTVQNLLFKIVTEHPRPVSALTPGLPHALDHIVQKAMAKEPSERYANTLDMANDLTSVRSKLSGPAYPASVSLSSSISGAIKRSKTTSQRRTRTLAFTGFGALAAVSLIAIAWSRFPQSQPANSDFANELLAASKSTSQQIVTAIDPPTREAGGTLATQPVSAPSPAEVQQESPTMLRHDVAGERGVGHKSDSALVTTSQHPASRESDLNGTAGEALVPTPPVVLTSQQVVPPPAQESPAIVSPPSTVGIASTVEAYARAIESRNIDAVRRAYPALRPSQQRSFEQFFQAARNINVTLQVASIEASGVTADVRLVGSYEYVTVEGRKDRQPVSFLAALRYDGNVWRIVSMR